MPQRILDAMDRPTIGHLDPAFVDLMEETKAMLRMAFKTENALTFPVSAPGSAGMEMCFVNLIEPGDKVGFLARTTYEWTLIDFALFFAGAVMSDVALPEGCLAGVMRVNLPACRRG